MPHQSYFREWRLFFIILLYTYALESLSIAASSWMLLVRQKTGNEWVLLYKGYINIELLVFSMLTNKKSNYKSKIFNLYTSPTKSLSSISVALPIVSMRNFQLVTVRIPNGMHFHKTLISTVLKATLRIVNIRKYLGVDSWLLIEWKRNY